MQDVNLYQPASKGVRSALSANSTRTTLIMVTVTLSGLWGFGQWQVARMSDATEVVRNQQRAQAALSAAQGPELQGLSDEEIAALLARLASSIDAKSRALALLAGEAQQAHPGFSLRLRAFGERHIDGIWLDHLTLGANVESVSISGSTLSPDSVPRYLRSLAADPALKGGQIDEFVIERPSAKQGTKIIQDGGRLTFKAGHRGLVQQDVTLPKESS